jgi:lipoyl synthase
MSYAPPKTVQESSSSALPKIRVKPGPLQAVRTLVNSAGVHTVCEGALCPNRSECYAQGHITVLILGDACTRNCSFCAVDHGTPAAVDPAEPQRVARLVERLEMRHVVVTSVTRDDLADGGAGQYARVAAALGALPSRPTCEALVPDFAGERSAVETVARSGYRILAHNVETVPRLYPAVRSRAAYPRSLRVLSELGRAAPGRIVKSGLMLGLGESSDEVRRVFEDLLRAGVSVLALGQYLRPTPRHLTVARLLRPEEFEAWGQEARSMGFRWVSAGPLVRSSYRAADALLLFDPK